jgi:octaprenyl-diphosphate synthase
VAVLRVLPKSQSDEASAGPAETAPSSRFDAELAGINRALEEQLTSRVPLVEEIAKYSVLGQGKRLRPLLFVLSARACGHAAEGLYRLSVVFETIHAASLLHDDVLDNAEVRRKKPSSARVWGNHAAVLGGDFLYSKAFGPAVASGNRRVLEILTDTSVRMAEGQLLELAHTNDWKLSRETYMEIITAKTAVLTSAACACGAAAAGAGEREIDCLARFGLDLGIAFQMIDDLLDYTSAEDVFGKPVGKDLREGKITLPLIRTLAGMDPEEAKALRARFEAGKAQEDDFERLIRRVREAPCLEEIRTEARAHVDRADRALEPLADGPAKQDLIHLNHRLLARSF